MSEIYSDAPVPEVNLPIAGEPPEGDVFQMVEGNAPAHDLHGYLRDKQRALDPALAARDRRREERRLMEEDANASKALEIRTNFEQGPDVTKYNYVKAAEDGRLPPKGALAEQFDPAYSIVTDPRSADEVAAENAMPNLLFDMGVRPTNIPVETPQVSPVDAWAGSVGMGEQMTGRVMVNAMAGIGNSLINVVRDVVGGRGAPGQTAPDVIPTVGAVGELGEPESAERITTFISQLALGNVAMSGVSGLAMAGALARETTAALLTEAIFNDPRHEFGGNIAPMVMEYFNLGSDELRKSLDSREAHDALVGRVMQSVEAAGLVGATVGPLAAKRLAEGYVDALGQHIASLPATTAASRQAGKMSFHVPVKKPDTAQTVSTRVPSAKKPKEKGGVLEDPGSNLLRTGSDAMAAGGTLEKGLDSFDSVPTTFAPLKGAKYTTEERLAHITRGLADNLLWLHDLFNPKLREMATHWYPGANKLARGMGRQYGKSVEQSAAVMAVLSPQKDWFMNMDQANRVMRAHAAAIASGWKSNPRMTAWGKTFADKKLASGKKSANKKLKEGKITADEHATLTAAHEKAHERVLGQFSFDKPPTTDVEKARWIRAYDETSFDRGYNVLSPDGDVIAPATKKANKKGVSAPARSAWGSFGAIKKAVSILEDGSIANVSKQLGKEHKVRNFYNNIAHPEDPTNVTIDTHAVAAALVRALSGNSLEVTQNFGGGGVSSSAHSGANGTYGIYHDAYNLAAAERGISPRAMQSITWEAVRGLFKPAQKTGGVDASVQEVWKQVQAGTITREEGLAEVLELVGGIEDPAWAKVVQ